MPMKRRSPLPDIAVLHQCFNYDPMTGAFTWKDRPRDHFKSDLTFARYHKLVAGTRAETPLNCGYQVIRFTIAKQRLWVMASWAAWAMTHGSWPDHEMDHENRDCCDNRLSNLRPATGPQNKWNSSRPVGATGLRGVTWNGYRFKATIAVDGKKRSLGAFESADLAHAAYVAAAAEWHGQFAFTRSTVRTGPQS